MPKHGRSNTPKGTYTRVAIRYWLNGEVGGPVVIGPRTDILAQAQSGNDGAKRHLARLVTDELHHSSGYNGPDLTDHDLLDDGFCNYA